MAACSSGASVSRSSSVSGVAHRRRDGRTTGASARLLDGLAVDGHGVARAVARPVPRGVMEDGEQPGPQVGAGLEAVGGAKGLEICVLHQIFRVGRHARQPQGRPIQAVDGRQRLGLERRPGA